jgi:hypothetical protein
MAISRTHRVLLGGLCLAIAFPWAEGAGCAREALSGPNARGEGGKRGNDEAKAENPATGKLEVDFFPIAGGDSDVGIGGGELSNVARLRGREEPGRASFFWKIEDAALLTFKLRNNSFIIPFIDVWAMWTVPHFGPDGRLRLEVRPSYTDERTLGYYGIGNASRYPDNVPIDTLEYRRTHPTLAAKLRVELLDNCFASIGSSFTFSRLAVGANTLLEQDRTSGSAEVRQLLGNLHSHAIELAEFGLEYDSRDQETVPHHGQHHMLLARLSPAFGSWMPYDYLQIEAIARFYTTPIPRWLSLSFRVVGDSFIGTPPFYELARFDDTPAIGGGKAIRGVPAQRYHGKVKVFGNLEARSDVLPFTLRNKPFVLAVALFFDGGRSWTEMFHAHPELDGNGLGLKYGVGGGLRLQEGKTFVVRADIAWSPDARPLGGYFDAGEIF